MRGGLLIESMMGPGGDPVELNKLDPKKNDFKLCGLF